MNYTRLGNHLKETAQEVEEEHPAFLTQEQRNSLTTKMADEYRRVLANANGHGRETVLGFVEFVRNNGYYAPWMRDAAIQARNLLNGELDPPEGTQIHAIAATEEPQ